MPRLALSFLGPPRVLLDGAPVEFRRRKPLSLLAYLAVTARPHSRDALTEMLYPGHRREQGYSNFRQNLTGLRRSIGEQWIVADQSGVRLKDGNDLWVDVMEFRRLIRAARGREKTSGSAGSEKSVVQAAALVRGPFLEGFSLKNSPEFEDWQSLERENLRRDEAWVLERRVDKHQSREEYREAIEQCQRWLSLDTFEESVHRRLMRLYALSGQPSHALKQYERARIILEKELGEKPARETEELREQIRRGSLGRRTVQKAAVPPAEAPSPPDPLSIPFVGRGLELGRLRAAAEQARGRKGRMVMLVGEAGIGKTRLLEEAAGHARGEGARVIWGRCYPDAGLPPLWPWRQALGQLVDESRPESLRQWAGNRAAVLGEMIEEFGEKLGTLAPPAHLEDPESQRFRLSEAVAHFLEAAAGEQPLTVVLDDLHCADSASLGLLEFVTRGLGDSRVLLLAACRNVETDLGHALGRTLGELARERFFERIELHALGKEQVAEMAERSAPAALPRGFADTLWERTRGNPFFVVESLRFRRMETARQGGHAESPAHELPIPPSVRALIRRQLQGVSRGCYELLETAAALGAEFTIEILGGAMKVPGPSLLGRLDEAVRARFLSEQRGGLSGRFRFRHPLMQETISEDLSRSRRSELHAGIARALEDYYGDAKEEHTIELARHYALAQPLASVESLTRYSLLAGEQELKDRAYEEALVHFQTGLAAKGSGMNDTETAWLRFGLARALPKAQFTAIFEVEFAGGDTGAFAELSAAFGHFVQAGDVDSAVKVAAYPLVLLNRRSGERQTLAARGLEIVPPGSGDEARLLMLDALVDYDRTRNYVVLSERLERALALARSHGDTLLELRIASSWAASAAEHSPEAAAEKVGRAQVLISQVDDPVAEYPVHFQAYHVALSRGDWSASSRHAEAMLRTAVRLRSDYRIKMALIVKLELSWVHGDWAGVRAASDQALTVESDSLVFRQLLAQRARLELELGNTEVGNRYLDRYIAELKRRGFGQDLETSIAIQELSQIARLTGERELLDLARTAAAAFIPPGRENQTQTAGWDFAQTGLVLESLVRGDCETLRGLRQWFVDHRMNWIPGMEGLTRTRLLGLIDLTLGDAGAAVGELEQAMIDYAAQRPGPNVAWICSELAEALLARATEGDAARAATLLQEGLAMATILGMVPLQERCRSLMVRVPALAKSRGAIRTPGTT
jgi:DNA-binding SARP family transcriptional activator